MRTVPSFASIDSKALGALATLVLGLHCHIAFAQSASSCPSSVSSSLPAPSVAPGFDVRLVSRNLTDPRGAIFDSLGHLLVVEQNVGVTALTFDDHGKSCVTEANRSSVVAYSSLNHGITLSGDGKTLYASSPEAVWSWPYDAANARVTGPNTTLVTNMTTSDHTTRTLLLSKKAPGLLVVTRGSTSNLDDQALDISTGHSQIKAFNITNMTGPYDFNRDGLLLGWGLRNDVGIDEHPTGGGLFAVENSADQITRDGEDIHQNNPAEKMNFLGYLNGTQSANQGKNFGYPQCFAAWNASAIPNFRGQAGQQFAIGMPNNTDNDQICQDMYAPPSQVFWAHMAPLSIAFNNEGSEAWITFHGSWDRSDPVGYKVGSVAFRNGEPASSPSSLTALTDIVANPDNSACPDQCFRPVGLAWDSQGRLYFTSDSSGEVYVITSASSGDGGVQSAQPAPSMTGGASATGSMPNPTTTQESSQSSGPIVGVSFGWLVAVMLGCVLAVA